jgi:hypothetical protein
VTGSEVPAGHGASGPAPLGVIMRSAVVRHSFPAAVAAGVALLVMAAGSATSPVQVALGVHRFGHLATPTAVVARATATQVGWNRPTQGAAYGPWSFDVARDGTIWLLDRVTNRLVRWSAGQPTKPTYVPLPYKAPEDFAVAADGSLFVLDKPAVPDHERLYALTETGTVRWFVDVEALDRDLAHHVRTFNSPLRFGPDGTLYEVGGADIPGTTDQTLWWTPLTTPAGAPLPVATMWDRRLAAQPLPGGNRLNALFTSQTAMTATITTSAGQVSNAWHITSVSPLAGNLTVPQWVAGSLVMSVDVFSSMSSSSPDIETIVLRLPATGGPVAMMSLSPRVTFGDTITTLRVGPDGNLYQLRSDPSTGVSIARYTLPATTVTPPATTTTPATTTPPATGPTTTTPTPTLTTSGTPASTAPGTTPPSTIAATAASGGSGTGPMPWILGGVGAAAAATAGGGWLRYRHTHGGAH